MRLDKKDIKILVPLVLVYLIVQILILNNYYYFRSDEIQFHIALKGDGESIFDFLIPGKAKLHTGGQVLSVFMYAIVSRFFDSFLLLKLLPLFFSILTIPLIYQYLKTIKLDFKIIALGAIIFHPTYLFYATDFKVYMSDVFFSFLILNLMNLNLSKWHKYLLSIFVFWISLPATLVFLCSNAVKFLNSKLEDKQSIFSIVITLISTFIYLKIHSSLFVEFEGFMMKYWAGPEYSLSYTLGIPKLFISLFWEKIKTIIYSFSLVDFTPIYLIFLSSLIIIFKKNKEVFYTLAFLIVGSIFASLIGKYPIPLISAKTNFYLTKLRTTFFFVPFVAILLGYLLNFLVKPVKNKYIKSVIQVLLVLTLFYHNYPRYFNSGFELGRKEEEMLLLENLKLVKSQETVYISLWEARLYNLYSQKNNFLVRFKSEETIKYNEIPAGTFILIHKFDPRFSTYYYNKPHYQLLKLNKTHYIFRKR